MTGHFCVCGNHLADRDFRMVSSPCVCEKPGEGRSTIGRESFLDDNLVSRRQYDQRKSLGLPVACEIEKSLYREAR